MATRLTQWTYTKDEAATITWRHDGSKIIVEDEAAGNSYTFDETGEDFVSFTVVDEKHPSGYEWPEGEPLTFTAYDKVTIEATIVTIEFMAMHFMECTAERNRVDKTAYLTEMFKQSGHLRDDCEITAPVIVFEYPGPQMPLFNYVYIPRFHRYYYLEKLVIVDTGLYEMYLKVDVLNTYKDDIKAQSGTVARNQYDYDSNITDGSRPLEATPVIARINPENASSILIVSSLQRQKDVGYSIENTPGYVITVMTTEST